MVWKRGAAFLSLLFAMALLMRRGPAGVVSLLKVCARTCLAALLAASSAALGHAGLLTNFAGTYPLYLQCTMEVADFDHDEDIDGLDFLMWQSGRGLTAQSNNNNGDADGSTVVNNIDFEMWMDQLGTTVHDVADSICFKMFLDPEGIIEGQITSYVDVVEPPPGQFRFGDHTSLIDIHPAYRANIVSSIRTFPAGRQRIETKIHFQARDMTNPPAGPVTLFGFQTEDMLPGLDLQGLQWGFEFQAGDFITTFDPGPPPVGPTTFGPAELDDVPLPPTLPLVLDVNLATGAMRLRNPSGAPLTVSGYQIASEGGSLNVPGWFSLDDQEMDPPGIGWEEFPTVNPMLVGESFVTGAAQILPSQPRPLGNLFNMTVGKRDLVFTFVSNGGAPLPGVINYAMAPATPVPEPSGVALAILGFTAAARRRRSAANSRHSPWLNLYWRRRSKLGRRHWGRSMGPADRSFGGGFSSFNPAFTPQSRCVTPTSKAPTGAWAKLLRSSAIIDAS
jgi:hypothetical protein